ncbi:glycosyl transferase family 36 [Rhodanobacter sp. FW510-R12]|uniref:GH36-type glycosyl hydrolase domain-containing protein n=1 Tax=Rhodanobacter TaxID=75309 RepID=UPI0004834246|nr:MULTISPECIES: glycosyl transferase family 36 [Rhodanobacter]TAN19575.1 MAG: glycosyl transferase family 36 [Rhodanobacter sp.]UJJ54935.1 glycosyl transferase family 36 [Rhodanobacter thiooxydans]
MPSPSSRSIDAEQRCLLSNGRYSVMLGANGAGFSRWRGLAVTRWREDPVGDGWGSYLLLRDEDDGEAWSASRQPYGTHRPDDAVAFDAGCARFSRRHHSVHSVLEVAVAADADIELRRLSLSNHGDRKRTLSLTSYAELVLGQISADDAHPAFSKMFVQTARDATHGMLLATRRRRDASEAEVWAAQAMQIAGAEGGDAGECETDRARFLGRLRTLRDAQAMQPGAALSNTVGCVLDPVFSLRRRFTLAPDSSVTLLLWTRLADSRDGAMALTTQLGDADAAERLFDGAGQQAEAERRRLGIGAAQAARFTGWMSALLYNDPRQRAAPDALARGRGGAPVLWSAGISGDRPIILLRLGEADDLARVNEVLQAQQYWRSQQLAVDVVLLHGAGDAWQAALDPLVSAQQARLKTGDRLPKAELFALRDDAIGEDLRNGLLTVARVVLDGAPPAPAAPGSTPAPAAPSAIRAATTAAAAAVTASTDAPEFANGYGGFVDGGRAYRIELDEQRPTPAPWVNVIANPAFGCMLSAEGGGYAWSLNSQQNPLTPWPNDPVSDSPHDVLYLRDEDTGVLWSATALPIRVAGAHYAATHGKGWTRFENDAHGIELELLQCVPTDDPLKLSRLRLRNRSPRARRLSVTAYVEWALGANGSTPAPFVITSRDERTGALFARNRWRPDFGDRVAFIDLAGPAHSMSGDRYEFLGPLGTVALPLALRDGAPLSGRLGAGLEPCGALQVRIELPPGTQLDLRLLLGEATDEAAAQALVEKYRVIDMDDVHADIAAQWNGLLDAVQVRTPDRALDILLNDWLPYQVAGCRLWARTAYYQASGAYGFRDQLQDVMALCVSRPDLAREHLLRAAGRQFAEGDVQHWWLPPHGQGIRTKVSDDCLWLAYVAMHYVEVSGDAAVLDEALPFLAGQPIPDGATDAFFQPEPSERQASVYEHCALAIDTSLACGAHGLPPIGSGDWNDGMNAVGAEGRGESSWLGWFLLATIGALAPYAERRDEQERAQRWRSHADALRAALERAWDGQWYRRGYYDDGTPLGSHASDECRIDAIAQSWSVLAGITDRAHAVQAMDSVDRLLLDHDNRIARLFTPPFDHSRENPGYIKGYPPGVRENGGQYTHGAVWSIFAWAGLGDGDRAGGLFNLLNPIRHGDSPEAIERYKVEPYVACADVYSVAPHLGRGGWTWYTGSAGWLYRAGLEALLGFHLHGERLRIEPCMPKDWPGFRLSYRRHGERHVTCYEIEVENPQRVCRGVAKVELDGQTLVASEEVPLADDGGTHRLRITLGP